MTLTRLNTNMVSNPTKALLEPLATRSDLVALVATGILPAVGTVLSAGGVEYRYDGVSTAIDDLTGWLPHGDHYPDHWAENTVPGTTDMAVALQSAADYGVARLFPVTYATSAEILVQSRDCGFRGDVIDYYPSTVHDTETYEGSRILYTGAATNVAVIRASKMGIGVEYVSAFDDSVFGVVIEDVLVDANDTADYGLYAYRTHGGLFRNVIATRANKHGQYYEGVYSGEYTKLHAWKNNGCGITIGRGKLDFGFAVYGSNAIYPHDLWGYANGLDGAFDETTNPLWGYGVGFFGHRGNILFGVRAENNDGPNCVFAPTGPGNVIIGLYSELGNSLDIGAGATSITQGRSTQKWGVWISPREAGAYGNQIENVILSGEYIRLTGTEPTPSRLGERIKLVGVALATGTSPDWGNWSAVDCTAAVTNNLIGSAVAPYKESGTVNGFVSRPFRMPQANASFDASAGSISLTSSDNCTITYAGAGVYDVALTDPMDGSDYSVAMVPSASNRIVGVSTKTASGFRILHQNSSGALTDSSAVLAFDVIGSRSA